jgi:hypothetical protein
MLRCGQQPEADSGQPEADSGQPEADSGQPEADSGQRTAVFKKLFATIKIYLSLQRKNVVRYVGSSFIRIIINSKKSNLLV